MQSDRLSETLTGQSRRLCSGLLRILSHCHMKDGGLRHLRRTSEHTSILVYTTLYTVLGYTPSILYTYDTLHLTSSICIFLGIALIA